MSTFLSTLGTWLVVAALGLLLLVLLDPDWVWSWRTPFLRLNRLQWLLTLPVLHWLRDTHSPTPRRFYFALLPLALIYTPLMYLLLLPVRLLTSLYFNLGLFWSVALRNELADLFRPTGSDRSSLWRYLVNWVSGFPRRLGRVLWKYPYLLLQGLFMALFDLVWPTLTLFHGTGRDQANIITPSGEWRAGSGNFVGTGLYFGLVPRVANYYARHNSEAIIIVARVTLFPCRPVATLAEELRTHIGGGGGDLISRAVAQPWVSLVHWRNDHQWYEFVLVQRQRNVPVKPWRVRPICILGEEGPTHVPGGYAPWPPPHREGVSVLASTLSGLALTAALVFMTRTGWGPAGALGTPAPNVVQPTPAAACAGAPPSALGIGTPVVVGADALNLRTLPQIPPPGESNVTALLPAGQRAMVVYGPACGNGGTWWRIVTPGGVLGWAQERLGEQVLLAPG